MTPLSTLSGMELRRKALEARGFKVRPRGTYVALHGPTGARLDEDTVYKTVESAWMDAPAIESDPAVSEPMFLEWCDSRHLNWEMADRHSALASQRIYLRVWNFDGGAEVECEVMAANPSEARARAIVSASAQEKK